MFDNAVPLLEDTYDGPTLPFVMRLKSCDIGMRSNTWHMADPAGSINTVYSIVQQQNEDNWDRASTSNWTFIT